MSSTFIVGLGALPYNGTLKGAPLECPFPEVPIVDNYTELQCPSLNYNRKKFYIKGHEA
jgi:hypothetical protein